MKNSLPALLLGMATVSALAQAPAPTPASPKPTPAQTLAAVPISAPATPLFKPTHVLSNPSLQEPLGQEWKVSRGTWTPANGLLTAQQIPAQHHPAVIHVAVGPANMAIECDVKFSASTEPIPSAPANPPGAPAKPKPAPPKNFIVMCDGTSHIGRVVIAPKLAYIAESTPNPATKKAGNHILTKQILDLKPQDWQHIRVEYSGDKIAVWVNDVSLTAEHPFLATPKRQWGFASGDNVQLRHIKVSSDQPMPPLPPAAKPAAKPAAT